MEVRPGYKQTEVGVIPQDWDAVKVRDASTNITVGFVGSMAHLFVRDGVPLLRGQNIRPQVLDLSNLKFISARTHQLWKKSALLPGDIAIVRVGYPGTACTIPEGLGDMNAASLVLVRPNKTHLDSEYLAHVLNSSWGKGQVGSLLVGGAQQVFNTRTAGEFVVPLPPIAEQRAIARALTDVNALLGGLHRLIAKKRDLKQAAIQQLLTGQTRLPGFNGEWEVKRLGETGTFLKGSGVKKDDANSGDLPCIRYGEIYTHHNDYIRSFNSWISSKVAATATRLRQGDLLFAGSGETKEEIGKCVALVDDREAFAGGDIVILRLANANPMFMGYYCNTAPINAQKASKGQGDAVVHISAAALSRIEVTLPRRDEQAAIAAVLSDMDAELSALEARRDKTRDVNQAMMHELLTGKTRLARSEPANA